MRIFELKLSIIALFGASLLGLGLLLGAPSVQANPDLAARLAHDCTGACHDFLGDLPQWAPSTKCSLTCFGCHVSPVGGGMRNDAGFRVAKRILALKTKLVPEESLEELSPKLGKAVRFGADFRSLTREAELEGVDDSIWTMQAAAYVSFEPYKFLNLVMMHDVKNNFGQYFALIKNLPMNSYIMAGRFEVPYGLKVDDHTSFIREKLGFGVDSADDGFLVGMQPGRPFLNLAYTNGARNPSPGAGDKGKAYAGNLGYWHERFSLGASYYRNQDATRDVEYFGGQATASYWKLSVLGQYDFLKRFQPGGGEIEGRTAFAQLNFFPIQGLTFRAQYDFLDPSIDIKEDALHRYSAGFKITPIPFIDLEASYRIYEEKPDIDNNQIVFVLHGYF